MECDVCLEKFDSKDNQPYAIVPCMHTYCLQCLLKLKPGQSCPACSKAIKDKCLNQSLWELLSETSPDWNRCKLCQKLFDHSLNKPMSLIPCMHTFCKLCVQNDSTLMKTVCIVCSQNATHSCPNWCLLKLIPESEYDACKLDLEKSINNLKHAINALKSKHQKRLYKQQYAARLKQIQLDLQLDKFNEFEMIRLKEELDTIKINQQEKNLFQRLFCFHG